MPSLNAKSWFIYIIRYQQNKLYTGITVDIARRLAQHQAGTGAKALRGKGALQLVFSQPAGDRASASRLEYRIKQLSKADKTRLVNGSLALESLVSALEKKHATPAD